MVAALPQTKHVTTTRDKLATTRDKLATAREFGATTPFV